MSERLGRELLQGDKEMLEAEVAGLKRELAATRQNAAIEIGGAEGQMKRLREELVEARQLAETQEGALIRANASAKRRGEERDAALQRAEKAEAALYESGRELNRRGQAIADAMGKYRGYVELIPAVKQMAERLEEAEMRAEKAEASLEFLGPFERPAPSSSSGNWRVGRKVSLNVYRGDEPKFQCHTPEDAAEVVSLLNGAEKGLKDRDRLEADCAAMREALVIRRAEHDWACDCQPCKLTRRALESNAGEKLLNEVTEERKLKRAVTDKYANYCIERNEMLARKEKAEAALDLAQERVTELEAERGQLMALVAGLGVTADRADRAEAALNLEIMEQCGELCRIAVDPAAVPITEANERLRERITVLEQQVETQRVEIATKAVFWAGDKERIAELEAALRLAMGLLNPSYDPRAAEAHAAIAKLLEAGK